jgi:hypothetical protein
LDTTMQIQLAQVYAQCLAAAVAFQSRPLGEGVKRPVLEPAVEQSRVEDLADTWFKLALADAVTASNEGFLL